MTSNINFDQTKDRSGPEAGFIGNTIEPKEPEVKKNGNTENDGDDIIHGNDGEDILQGRSWCAATDGTEQSNASIISMDNFIITFIKLSYTSKMLLSY